ncbi:hypothetical protein BD560DRAFT_304483, partial [Blakeslea trispora]
LPYTNGGVGLLDPYRQHKLLQVKWIFNLFERPDEGLVAPALKHHLSFLSPISGVPTLALFEPTFRSNAMVSHTSVINAIFKAFDHFGVNLDISSLALVLILKLPLFRLFQPLPQDHWLHRHTGLLADSFFIIDSQQNRLRLRVKSEYTVFPRLCYTLYLDILRRRTVQL